jgi:hypothetical protein
MVRGLIPLLTTVSFREGSVGCDVTVSTLSTFTVKLNQAVDLGREFKLGDVA